MRLLFAPLIFLVVAFFAFPVVSAAGTSDYVSPLQDTLKSPITDYKQIADVSTSRGLIFTVITFAYYLLFAVATLFIIIAAYNFVLGGADKSGKKVQLAQAQLKYAIIALIVGLLVLVIPKLVTNTVENAGTGANTTVPPQSTARGNDTDYCTLYPLDPYCRVGPY